MSAARTSDEPLFRQFWQSYDIVKTRSGPLPFSVPATFILHKNAVEAVQTRETSPIWTQRFPKNRYNIRVVTFGELGDLQQVSQWGAAAPDRIIPATNFLQPRHDAQEHPFVGFAPASRYSNT